MADWNPSLYSRFEDERTRPARELLARVPLDTAVCAVDLGCGPANSTELIVDRFPGALVIGTDNSKSMLESAARRLPGVRFDLSDIATWQPDTAPDLVYANASLQWVPNHRTLIPRLFETLSPGGVLAIQMHDNRDEPTHRSMREVALQQPWASAIGDVERLRTAILPLAEYYDLLAPRAAQVDVWHTVYQHRMDSPQAIVDWVSSTGLKPFVEPLDPALKAGYLAEYLRLITAAYPPRADGRLLLAFPRMFIVAQKKS